jgi:hypothetical protein
LEEFEQYAEIRTIIPIAINLSWIYLIRFVGEHLPERQQIELEFRTHNRKGFSYPIWMDDMDDMDAIDSPLNRVHSGVIKLRISHTRRSWGTDIENLLSNHLRGLVRKSAVGIQGSFARNRKLLQNLCAVSLALLMAGAGLRLYHFIVNAQYASYNAIPHGTDQWQNIIAKVDFVAGNIMGYNIILSLGSAMYFGVSLALLFSIPEFVQKHLPNREPSFILLTRSSIEEKERTMARYRRQWQKYLFGFAINIGAGVIGNIIFAFL